MQTKISVGDLRPADVLLHAGTGQISALIKWASESEYSHAAMVYDDTMLAEAMSKGVRFDVKLTDRAADTDEFTKIDVIRAVSALSPVDCDQIRAAAQAMKAMPFALNQMVELGVICVVKNKLTPDPRVRRLIWWLSGKLLPSTSRKLVCSEFVYLALHTAVTTPPGIVDPVIPVLRGPKAPPPFPDIDWAALWDDYERARQSSGQIELAGLPDPPDPDLIVSDEMLAQALEVGLRQVDMTEAAAGAGHGFAGPSPIRIPHPAAATVLPQDLANSETFRFLGQLL